MPSSAFLHEDICAAPLCCYLPKDMRRCAPTPASGFTMVEIVIAMAIALIIIAIAIPSVQGVMERNKEQDSFDRFDKLAQQARAKSLDEGRNYILVWALKPGFADEMQILLRPEGNPDEVTAQLALPVDEVPQIVGWPAKLASGGNPLAIWTFWANGSCEPVVVHCPKKGGGWTAKYNAFTTEAEVSYE